MVERTTGAGLWIISDDAELCGNVTRELGNVGLPITIRSPRNLHDPSFWKMGGRQPEIILLDIGSHIDWGVAALRSIKRARVSSPVIVVAREFSQEFGTKIVSEGVSYSLLRDFDGNEFREVVASLRKSTATTEHSTRHHRTA